ncbi:unnamed protein product [Brachionus calyciflorus]|uniref:Uncharacterized protein n=1 Tax=Brachionus calyciflorus TaxID=104777 RepID=A0A813M1W2_9BILA|nr:unnamed protein product [Brachionus calyciflorus]
MFDYENRFMSRSNSISDNREPYEIVIDKNLRSRAKRLQDDTREELSKVLERVENTLHEYERSSQQPFDQTISGSNIEFLVDINELQEILNDKVAKFKYKQRITVFIVGQCEAIEKKNILLEQLNDFFNDQQQNFDPGELNETNFDFDLENVKEEFEDAVEMTKIMGTRLDELNENIIQYLIANMTSKQTKALIERSRKKLEKGLLDARDEVSVLSERLNVSQAEINLRDDKIKALIKQIELKNSELKNLNNRKKILSDTNSKQESSVEESNLKDNEINLLKLKLKKKEQEINILNRKLAKSGIEIQDLAEEIKEINDEDNKEELNEQIKEQNDNINSLTDQKENSSELKLDDFEIKEIDVLKYKYEQDILTIRKEYETQLEIITNKLKEADVELAKFRKKPKPKAKPNQINKNLKFNKNQKKLKEKSLEIDLNEEAENLEKLEQDAENEKQLKMIDDLENGGDIEEIDLTTDDWVNVIPTEITKRYDMIRRYATAKINSLKKNYETLESTDREKIEKLKKQYFDHKKLWETEKLVLLNMKDMELNWDQERSDFLDQAELAYKLQVQAQDAAENAIKQLEEFITEDAKLDRENAENTIQILRERSRTFTSLSIGNKEEPIEDEIENFLQNTKKLSTEKSEKIQVTVDNFTIKFPNKQTMDKIIEYINFETSNKFTLILNHAPINSRPNTRNGKTSSQSQSPIRKQSSLKKESSYLNGAKDRKSAKPKKNLDMDKSDFEPSEIVEQVVSKIITDDEAVFNELRNSVRSRNSLRSKHLAQLEASKEKLNEIKTLATQKLIGMDQDLPLNEDELNRSYGLKRDATSARVKVASEAVLNRVSSSKTPKPSLNISIISHPIVLEYIKTYDIVVNFKNLILKHVPESPDQKGIFFKILERLNTLKTIEYDQEMTITPQIINMTSNVDTILNEIKLIFSDLIDEVVALKYDLLEKEKSLVLKSSRPNTSLVKEDLELQKLETRLAQKEDQLNEREYELKQLEADINQKIDKFKEEKEKMKEAYANLEAKYESETKKLKKQIEEHKIEIEEMTKKIQSMKTHESSLILPPIKRKSLDSTKTDVFSYLNRVKIIIFTRLDASQNEKRLRNALVKGTITEFDYQNVKNLMESYVNLQENRLVELMKFYLNLKQIQSIKENIQNEDIVNTEQFLENMQKLHEKKAIRYMEKVKKFKENRISLANQLTDALNDIEQQSGIFLVKPFCSYKGLDPNLHFMRLNKLTRSASAKKDDSRYSSNKIPNPNFPLFYQRPAVTDPDLLVPKLLNQSNWNVNDSMVQKSINTKKSIKSASEIGFILDTPKILEIDINRMMISQNHVASSVNSNEKFSSSVRSYLAFNRPHGTNRKEINQDSESNFNNFPGRNLNSPVLPPIVPNKNSLDQGKNESEIAKITEPTNGKSNIDNIEEHERGCCEFEEDDEDDNGKKPLEDGIIEENFINNYDVPYISDIDIKEFNVAVEKILDYIKIGFIDSYRFLSVLSGEQKKEMCHQFELNDIDFEKKGTRYEIVNIFKKTNSNKEKKLDHVSYILKRIASIELTSDIHVDDVVNNKPNQGEIVKRKRGRPKKNLRN